MRALHRCLVWTKMRRVASIGTQVLCFACLEASSVPGAARTTRLDTACFARAATPCLPRPACRVAPLPEGYDWRQYREWAPDFCPLADEACY